MIHLNNVNMSQRLTEVGLFLFLMLSSISYLTTTSISKEIIFYFRYFLISLILLTFFLSVLTRGLGRNQIAPIVMYVIAFFWSISIAAINNAFDVASVNYVVNFALTVTGIYFIACMQLNKLSLKFVVGYVVYVIIGLIFVITVQGLTFSFPPKFIFESASKDLGVDLLYSQGITKFFGLGSVFSAYLYNMAKKNTTKVAAYFFTFVFLILSLLGGGRGDFVVSLCIAIFILHRHNVVTMLLLSFIAFLFFALFESNLYLIDDMVFFYRFSALGDGDLSSRDFLFSQVIDLLINQSQCLWLGCGAGYFQSYYGYEYGMYPHNFIAESVIIYGLIVTIFAGIIILRGIYARQKNIGFHDMFFIIFIYHAFLGLKSGNLFGGWILLAYLMYYMHRGLLSIRLRKHLALTESGCLTVPMKSKVKIFNRDE